MEERAIPMKLPVVRMAFAVPLRSGGKKSATRLYDSGPVTEQTAPCRNLIPQRTPKEVVTLVVKWKELTRMVTKPNSRLLFLLLVKYPANSPQIEYGRL